MKNTVFSKVKLLFAAALVASALLLAGCDLNGSEKEDLNGSWASAWGEVYTIDTSAKTFSNSYATIETYAGNKMVIDSIDETCGYIYFVYTRAMNSDFTYSESAPDAGKWYAVYYKDLTETSVNLSAAYKLGGKTSCDSLREARNEFTVENGYFSFGSDCTKE